MGFFSFFFSRSSSIPEILKKHYFKTVLQSKHRATEELSNGNTQQMNGIIKPIYFTNKQLIFLKVTRYPQFGRKKNSKERSTSKCIRTERKKKLLMHFCAFFRDAFL